MSSNRTRNSHTLLQPIMSRALGSTRSLLLPADGVPSVDTLDAGIRAFSVATVVLLSLAGYGRGGDLGSADFLDPSLVAAGLVAYNLLVATIAGVPWRRPPSFGLFVLDWLFASIAITLTGGFFSPFIVLYYALAIGAALRVGLSRSLLLVLACGLVYTGLSFARPEPEQPIRLPVLVVAVTSLVMVVVTSVGLKRAVEAEARRVELEEQSTARLRLLHRLTNTVLSASPDLVKVMSTIALVSSQAVEADSGLSVLFQGGEADDSGDTTNGDRTLLVSSHGVNPPALSRSEQELLARTIVSRAAVLVHDASTIRSARAPGFPGLERHGSTVRAVACVPFLSGDVVIGALFVGRYEQRPFARADVSLLEAISQQMAIAVRLARLYEMEREKAQRSEERELMERDLLSMVSHELRTPLTSIKTCVGALQDVRHASMGDARPAPSTEARLLQNIDRSADRLITLVNEVLDMARLRAGRVTLNEQELNMGDVITDVVAQFRPLVDARGQSVETDLPAAGSHRWERLNVLADRRRIEQVLVNLLSNANKYAPEGGVIVVGATPRNGQVRIFVRDDGPGIAPIEHRRVFDKFYQVPGEQQTAERRPEGMGLGLAIARSIVELHGGHIGLHSHVGQGSTFYFALPEAHAQESPLAPDAVRAVEAIQ